MGVEDGEDDGGGSGTSSDDGTDGDGGMWRGKGKE